MNYSIGRGILWLGIFGGMALIPLGLARLGRLAEPRAFLVEFGVALGLIALALLSLQFIFSGRIKKVAPEFGMDNLIQYHREIGWLAFILVFAHPLVLIWANPSFLEYFDPRVNALRTIFLTAALVATAMIFATSVWRLTFGLRYEWWRALHGVLALFIVFIGVVHTFQVGHYFASLWKKALLALLMAGAVYPLVHTRLVRPWLSRKRPYRVVRVEPERDRCWSLTLDPLGHEGMRFRPGQFAWVTFGNTPFTLQQHPFSIVSSARNREISFTAKELGDFTSSWKDIGLGTPAFLEGPFGSFTPDPSRETGLFLVMGGIGITPAIGMLRTLRDDADQRPVLLIYGNQEWDNVTFREELDELSKVLNLKVIHLLENPPAGWDGEVGFVTPELLERHLPTRPVSYQYFICGPKPLMDVTEVALRDIGIPWERIYTERFDIV